ncbi:hypothetical protein [Campylobacter concisus]|uniref:Large polyvalent protein associated domain-containing protein n=1 Tax=Campylobacter concisus UNSW2 TaxID=1242965 RepID=U2GYQ9_9BACT|nr:hypothetical protein [Campylobacter concisus]ERJ31093.1 hypothetical protein UNSW2_1055 [Campylobacter concisus UNSW2]
MSEKCPLKEIQKRSNKLLDRWAIKVDDAFDKASEKLDETAKWIDENIPFAGELLNIREHGKEIDELLGEYHRATAAIYTQAGQFKEYLGKLSLENRKAMFKALDGEMDPEELAEHVRPLYEKVRKTIDDGAQALVDAGALESKNVIKDYIKHYYKKHMDEAKENSRIAKALRQSKFFARKQMSWEQKQLRQIEDDAAFAVTNTILEQKKQLLKAQTLKLFADKFAKDAPPEGAEGLKWVRMSDESAGGGIKKYGALAGKYVPEDVAKALAEAEMLGREMAKFNNMYFKLIDHIKVNVTVKNPFTHLYNFGSNMALAFLHGDFNEAMKTTAALMRGDKQFKRWETLANSLGLDSHLSDLEGLVKPLQSEAKDGILTRALKEAYMAEGSWSGEKARYFYSMEDKVFKIARFKKNLELIAKDKGFDVNNFSKFSADELKAAMKDAQYSYVDYSTHFNGTLKMLDKTGVQPFLHYAVKSTPMVLKAALKRPDRFLMMQAVLASGGGSAWLGADNERDNLAKPEWAESGALPNLVGVKSWMELFNTGWYFNSGRLVPGFRFDGFDKLEFNGGFVGGAINIASGKSTLGYKIESDDDPNAVKITKRLLEIAKSYFPPLSPLGRYGQQLGAQATADITGLDVAPKDYNKEELGFGGIMARGAGVRRFDKEKEYGKELKKARKEYEQFVPVKIPNSKDEEKVAKAKAHNERIAKLSVEDLREAKAMSEDKFKRIKEHASADGVKLDIGLLRQSRQSSGSFGSSKIKFPE